METPSREDSYLKLVRLEGIEPPACGLGIHFCFFKKPRTPLNQWIPLENISGILALFCTFSMGLAP